VNKYLQLFRLGNCIMGVIGLILATIIAAGAGIQDHLLQLALASGVVFLFIIGGNSLNDYLDREIDQTAHPERPIPSGRIKPADAKNIVILAFALTIILSLPLRPSAFLVVISAVIIMLAYELITKKRGLLGNLSIAWLTGSLFLLGGAVVDRLEVTVPLAAMAFLATLGREIVKDVEDMASDAGRRTLPQRIGAKRAGLVASAAFLTAVALSFEPFLIGRFGVAYLAVVLVADGIFIYCSTVHFRNPTQGQSWAKKGMLVALIAFLMGGLL